MLAVVLLLAVVSTVGSTVTCMDSGVGPCLPYDIPGFHICPDGSACLVNTTNGSFCCSLQMISNSNCYSSLSTPRPTTPGCVDKANPQTGENECKQLAYLCNDSGYYNYMTQNCPATCGRCDGVPSSTPACVDQVNPKTGKSDCPNNKPLCTNPPYIPYMQAECPLTCGFC